jgi:DNA ligase 1
VFIAPMLAHQSDRPFDDDEYIAEPKMDGFRLILSTMDGIRAYTRHGNDVTDHFPELSTLSVPSRTVLDGELIVTDDGGRPDFEAVMRRLQARKPEKIERLAKRLPVQYVVFDVLYNKGRDVTKQPLMERKAMLSETIDEDDIIATIRYVEGCGTDLFNTCSKMDLEGIVLKKKDTPYLSGKRSKAWQKVINYKEAKVVITGYRKREFGWIIGIEEGSDIRPVGVLELGVSPAERKALYEVSSLIKITENEKFVYLEPRLRCKVKYRGWTSKGYMRLPVFQHFIF